MQPKVSIIVPVYNGESYLARCVESLRKQTLEAIEIILVDDGSQDNTAAICATYAAEDGRIRVLRQENAGAGPARNRGLEAAKGEFIGFVDADDFAEPDMYAALYGAAIRHQADMALAGTRHIGGIVFGGGDTLRGCFQAETLFCGQAGIKRLLLGTAGALPGEPEDSRYGFSVCKNIYRSACIQENQLRFVSERQFASEDLLFLLDFIPQIQKAVGIPGAYYCYCRNSESFSKGYQAGRFQKSKALIVEMEKRLSAVLPREEFQLYLDRQLLAYARVASAQAIMHAADCGLPKEALFSELFSICRDPATAAALRRYPYWRLPVKQAAFAFAMRHRLFALERLLVCLRKKI